MSEGWPSIDAEKGLLLELLTEEQSYHSLQASVAITLDDILSANGLSR